VRLEAARGSGQLAVGLDVADRSGQLLPGQHPHPAADALEVGGGAAGAGDAVHVRRHRHAQLLLLALARLAVRFLGASSASSSPSSSSRPSSRSWPLLPPPNSSGSVLPPWSCRARRSTASAKRR